MSEFRNNEGVTQQLIFRRWITTKDGKRIYPKNGRCFAIWIDVD